MNRGAVGTDLGKWTAPRAGAHYDGRRFATSRAASRDPRIVARLLDQVGWSNCASVLDVPSGTGRLREAVAASTDNPLYVGVDISRSMLRNAGGERSVEADVYQLPFRDGAFEVVVCCRLLHHLASPLEFAAVARELLRVARTGVIASYWDANSLPNWRARLGLRRRRADTRIALPRREVQELFNRAGGDVLAFAHSFRFVSQQTFVAVGV